MRVRVRVRVGVRGEGEDEDEGEDQPTHITLQVLWKYHDKDTQEPLLIWSPGRIARVADGLPETRSARAKDSPC